MLEGNINFLHVCIMLFMRLLAVIPLLNADKSTLIPAAHKASCSITSPISLSRATSVSSKVT